jgi:GntR family transcriptional regulator
MSTLGTIADGVTIDCQSPLPYYYQLEQILLDRIESGNWRPDQQVPSERELCEGFSVSRTVVRQALNELANKGFLYRRKGKGTFVAQPKVNESLIQKLTGFYEDMVERGYEPETQVLLQQVSPASQKVAEKLAIPEGTPVIEIERLRSIKDEPILLVMTYLPYALCPGLLHEDLANQSLYHLLENNYNCKIVRGRRTIEAVAANEREAQLLKVSKRAPLVLLDSVSYLEDGRPVEYFHAVHRGDRTRFEVELIRNHTWRRPALDDLAHIPSAVTLRE